MRMSGRQLVVTTVAICVAVVAMPIGVLASTGVIAIADPTHSSYRAHVSSRGQLATYTADPSNGVKARVDASGHQLVALPSVSTVRLAGARVTLDADQGVDVGPFAVAKYGEVTVAVSCHSCPVGVLAVTVISTLDSSGHGVVFADNADGHVFLQTYRAPGSQVFLHVQNTTGSTYTPVNYAIFARP